MSFPYRAKTLEVRICFYSQALRLVTLVASKNLTSMDDQIVRYKESIINGLISFKDPFLLICLTSSLILLYLELKELYKLTQLKRKLRQALEESGGTRQDILSEYKNNPGHNFLPRGEGRFKNWKLERYLKRSRRQQQRSRFIGYHTKEKGREPIEIPAVEKFSRSRQLTFQSSPILKPKPQPRTISHRQQNIFFHKLCIYTALPFLTFSFFFQSLRMNLTESYSLQAEVESEDELDLF